MSEVTCRTCSKPLYYSGGCNGEWEHRGECKLMSEVDNQIKQWENASELERLREDWKQMKKALEFYGFKARQHCEINFKDGPKQGIKFAADEWGGIARITLKNLKVKE